MNVWAELGQVLRASPPYRRLREELGDVVRLPLPAAAWVGELLAEDLERPLLVLVPREADALAWVEAARLVRGDQRAVYLPAPALTPYQETPLSLAVRAHEVQALERLLRPGISAVVGTPRALFLRIPVLERLAERVLEVAPGDEQPIESLLPRLLDNGYQRTDLVRQVGEMAVRGGVIDLWPPGLELPVRLDLFGDSVESIRLFEVASQRSTERLERVRILPLTLFPAGPGAMRELSGALSRRLGRKAGVEVLERLRGLQAGSPFPGWENLLALLQEETCSVVDLLPAAAVLAVSPETLLEEARSFAARLEEDFATRRALGGVAPAPDELLIPFAEVAEAIDRAALRIGVVTPGVSGATPIDFGATTTDVLLDQIPRLPRDVASARARGERVLVVCEAEHEGRLRELLEGREVPIGPQGAEIVTGELTCGFRLPPAGVTVFAEAQLVPRRAAPLRRAGAASFGPFLSGLQDLKVRDFVVHVDHGIGQFVGLRTVAGDGAATGELPPSLAGTTPIQGQAVEVMEIAYAGGRTLLLPLSRIDQIQKYGGIEGMAPRLDQLGGTSWNRTRERVKKSLKKLAMDLLALYAERQKARAPAMLPETDLQRHFAAAFAFDETEDQLQAIAAIDEDLQGERPMDRLLVGDVGFGKTEVAMRAAFKVVESGYQVAVLAPTTILADQHLETFRRRLAGFPVNIEMVSRFRRPAEIRGILKRAAEGEIDILIGTHRLLSKDVELPLLGLLIIDEEQRFGVAQKERLRELRRDLHVLAMSATPVPRTLQLSLAGVRELSVIETPPRDRMAVETVVLPFQEELVREAIEHERQRGGQTYYVHNRVEEIEVMAGWLRELVPGLTITVGHGQMDEQELARRMHAFTAGDYDLLLATTIIENGIHIPRVNTMLVHRADRFGLAQLYQLRGRVGRSSELGYCYLLVPGDRVLPRDARQRLEALQDFTELGAGFRIAARDLEIRGAGNLLGAEQSGHIAAVGIETYLKMLEEAIRELGGEAAEQLPSATLDLPVPLMIPVEYIPHANVRMEIYRKLVSGETDDQELLAELGDRFGPPPPAVFQLLEVAQVKRLAEGLRVQALSWQAGELVIRLRRDTRIAPERLVELISENPQARFSPSGVLSLRPREPGEILGLARSTLERLAS
jgi:transcription-repair coupling factor (superfamily II helicase)